MKIKITTVVDGFHKDVFKAFDKKLFEFLKPIGARIEIVDFTGSTKGDKVHIRFLSPIKTEWISEIIEDHQDEQLSYFIDQGTVLPWPLKSWNHKHIVEMKGRDQSIIIDDIDYKTANVFFDVLIFPIMYISFYQRKPLYRKFFRNFK